MVKMIKTVMTVAVVAALGLTAACSTPAGGGEPQTRQRDTLDSTVWTSYHSNGVDILMFDDGKFVNRFYDAITGDEDTERSVYTVDGDYIEVTRPDSVSYKLYFEITAGGNTLSVYKNKTDLNNNKPNVVFKKL